MQFISLLFYNISIRLYGFAIFVASFFNKRAKLWIEGRGNQQFTINDEKDGKRIWIHCASLGEFEQARPVIEKIKSNKPSSIVILTFFSPSGYEIRKNYPLADKVLYLPLDTAINARQFIASIKPDLALFIKYEFWHHYLSELRNQKIPTVLFSAIFRREQIFFNWYGTFFRNMLACFDKIFVQNKESHDLLTSIAIKSEISFDTRFDRVFQIAQSAKTFPLIDVFRAQNKILIAGSTWPKDEELIIALINKQILKNHKYIIAPHNLNESEIAALQKSLHNTSTRLSQLTEANTVSTEVIIVDTMGDLSSLYSYANIAYVGGAFNASVHNVLEAAVYGLPVIFGPNYLKSAEAKELLSTGTAFSVTNYDQLQNIVTKLDDDAAFMKTVSAKATGFVKRNLGGTNHIYNNIEAFL